MLLTHKTDAWSKDDEVDEYYNSLPEGEDPDYEYVDSLTKVQYYYDDADIDKLLPTLTSGEVYTYRWDGGKDTDPDYSVSVDFAGDSEISEKFGGYSPCYNFFAGEVPDFVVRDTQ